jgi:hypothetical protein
VQELTRFLLITITWRRMVRCAATSLLVQETLGSQRYAAAQVIHGPRHGPPSTLKQKCYSAYNLCRRMRLAERGYQIARLITISLHSIPLHQLLEV